MDIIRIYDDFNIDYKTEGHRHTRPGWVNTPCPFCTGSFGYHLGWNIEYEYYYCWRCGWKHPVKTIATLLNVTAYEVTVLLQRYGVNRAKVKTPVKRLEKPLILPTGLTALTPQHKVYLERRGFDATELENTWKLQSTGPMSKVEHSFYKHRIFIPIYWNGQLVTYDTRDVTDKAEDKYKACPVPMEIKHRKSIIFGKQEAWEDGVGICVEGPFDVFRFGEKAFATCGTAWTQEQVRCISQVFKKVFICYDKETQAQKQARKLKAELRVRGVDARITPLEYGDPGEQQQEYANQFVQHLLSL